MMSSMEMEIQRRALIDQIASQICEAIKNNQIKLDVATKKSLVSDSGQGEANRGSSGAFWPSAEEPVEYKLDCRVENRAYFGEKFTEESINAELVYEDLPKPVTEFNKAFLSKR